jgi:hypothetical protein
MWPRSKGTPQMLNIATRKVGGIRFVKLGRLTFSFCISREFKPFAEARPAKRARVVAYQWRETQALADMRTRFRDAMNPHYLAH